MPSYGAVLKWVKRFPEFQEMYVAARQAQGDFLFDEARDVARAATRETVPVARLQFDVIRWQAARLAPEKYLERVVAAEARASAAGADSGRGSIVFSVTSFEVGPDGAVLAAPPRSAQEAQAWVTSTGQPYAPGVGPKGHVRAPIPPGWRDASGAWLVDWGAGRAAKD